MLSVAVVVDGSRLGRPAEVTGPALTVWRTPENDSDDGVCHCSAPPPETPRYWPGLPRASRA